MKPIVAGFAAGALTAGLPAALVGGAQPQAAREGPHKAPLAALPSNAILKDRLQSEFAKLVQAGFVGIVRIDARGETVLRASAGYADPVAGRKFEPDTPILINSITKPFTAAAILKLQEQGKLSVRDPLSRFFPTVPRDKANVTVHQLLTHSSGLPLDLGATDLEPIDRDMFLRRAFAARLLHRPGEKLEYSNIGYGILAALIERVSGRDYETFVADELLRPFGFRHIGYGRAYDEVRSARTRQGLTVRQCCWGAGGPYWHLIGNGGFVADPDELVEWRKALASGRILSAQSLATMMTGWVPEGEGNAAEGYGWVISDSPARGRVELAGGGNPFFKTGLRYYRNYDLLVHVSTNGQVSPGEAASRLVGAAFGEPRLPPT